MDTQKWEHRLQAPRLIGKEGFVPNMRTVASGLLWAEVKSTDMLGVRRWANPSGNFTAESWEEKLGLGYETPPCLSKPSLFYLGEHRDPLKVSGQGAAVICSGRAVWKQGSLS